ncbi:helix-turn-helix transcriptional regulator [Bacillus carboniphilus]|uniref:Helix-turn-helix transcriptional regulator n=1 Tax=Bacillus carboniphilus TaxID=86663 RepID=A0ABN0VYM3_9BACI
MEADKWGRRIRAYRKLKGFTQEGLAKEIGISISLLGEVERGSREPSPQLIEQISSALKVSVEELNPNSND